MRFLHRESPVLLTRQHRGSAEKREVENKKEKYVVDFLKLLYPCIFEKSIWFLLNKYEAMKNWTIKIVQNSQRNGVLRPFRQGSEAMLFSTPGEGDAAGKEPGCGVFVPGTVLVIAQQREATAGKLYPNLVAAAGVKPNQHRGRIGIC